MSAEQPLYLPHDMAAPHDALFLSAQFYLAKHLSVGDRRIVPLLKARTTEASIVQGEYPKGSGLKHVGEVLQMLKPRQSVLRNVEPAVWV